MTTTTTEREPRERVSDASTSESNGEQPFQPLLLAALLARREDRGDAVSPLVLALLSGRREDRGDAVTPLVLALLSGRREDRGDAVNPLLLATLAQRSEQRNGADKIAPILLGALTGQS